MSKNNPYSMLFQKEKVGSPVKDLLEDFHMVCTSVPFFSGGEAKELPSNDWHDEDGNDTYYPNKLCEKAYSFEVGLAYKGNLKSALTAFNALRDYLFGKDGNGILMKVYNSHVGIGRQHVYAKNVCNSPEHNICDGVEFIEFSITLQVDDPNTDIAPNVSLTALE